MVIEIFFDIRKHISSHTDRQTDGQTCEQTYGQTCEPQGANRQAGTQAVQRQIQFANMC